MTYWLFQKPEEAKEPFVLVRSRYKKRAQTKLIEIVDGEGYTGTWQYTKLDEKSAEPLLKKYIVGELYQKEASA